MIEWMTDNAWVTWVGIAVLLAVAELLSLDLVLLMFALGALAAAVAAASSTASYEQQQRAYAAQLSRKT